MSSPLLADIRTRSQEARRRLHDTARAERRALADFSQKRIGVPELRQAIRDTVTAERDAQELALLHVAVERLVSGE